MAMYVGIDVGGTNTRVALFQSLDEPHFTLVTRFPTFQDYKQQLDIITASLEGAGVQKPVGIGVSVGARIAKDGRSVAFAPNLPGYVDQPFARDLELQWSCPVRLALDTACGLLGEKKFGSLRSYERCAYLTLSTGTGASFHLQNGSTALTVSIDVGHQILDGNDLLCLCGQVGCLETLTGGRQLELRLGHSIAQISDPAFWDFFCAKLALGLINLVQLTRVEMITVSGAIALHNPFLLPLLQQKVNERIRGTALSLQLAQLGENAPLIGAVTHLCMPADQIVH